MTDRTDIAIIGGGIVGLATAYQISARLPDRQVIVLEKEDAVAAHQTGRNSGVLHSGIYYKPGSRKARNCREGKLAMERFCAEHGVPFDVCGKVIVAVDESEFDTLERIFLRGQENGVRCELISGQRVKEIEPHAAALRGIHVPEAGIVDYAQVCERLASIITQRGNEVWLGHRVNSIKHANAATRIVTSRGELEAKWIVNCAGLQCDRVTKMGGGEPEAKIVPFRGEYFELKRERQQLCRNLIYPVPDPNFPFLGVHFTRMIAGGVECGPNAVLAFAREGYTRTTINLYDVCESLTYSGFLRMAMKHWKMGCGEMWRSFNKRAFVKALQRIMPEIKAEDLTAGPAGVRAQALLPDGLMVDDFLIVEHGRMISVNNAPSPAATASLKIGEEIAGRVVKQVKNA